MDEKSTTVSISMGTIIKFVVVIIAILFLYWVRDVIVIVIVSGVFASAITPWVDKLQRRNVPRIISIVAIYVVVIGLFSLAIALIVPAMTNQLSQFSSNFPSIYEKFTTGFIKSGAEGSEVAEAIQTNLQSLISALGNITSGIFAGLSGIFGGLFSLIGVLVLTFYITLIENGFKKLAMAISPAKYQPYLFQLINRIQNKLGFWIKGQFILSLIIGVASFVGLTILGIPYALVLGLVAGVTEFIPIAGPIIGAVPAVLIALTVSPWKAIFVVILYIIIQQLENNLLVPKVMQKVTGLNPIIVIVAMLLGARLLGILGIMLAIPVTIIGEEFLKDFFKERREKEDQIETESIS